MARLNELTQATLKQVLKYNPDTGLLTWINAKRGISAGSVAGSLNKSGYVNVQVFGKVYRAHNLAHLYMTGAFPIGLIDHKDCVKNNNIWSNLRQATKSQNAQNATLQKRSKSGVKGVCFDSCNKKWVATISKDNKHFWLGRYKDKDSAVFAVEKARTTLHKEFANHG